MKRRIPALLLCVIMMLAAGCEPRTDFSPGSIPELPIAVPEPEPEPTRQEITLLAVGDLMVHQEQLDEAYDAETNQYDFAHCFAPIARDFEQADLRIGNLETVFGGEEAVYSTYPMFNTPDSFGTALRDLGFDFLSTSNNHCLDRYEAGLVRTLDVLDELEIAHTGTWRTQAEREQISLMEVDGIRIALLSFTFSTNGIPMPEGKDWMVGWITEEEVIETMAAARALEPDLIVVLPHNGVEYETFVREPFVWWADFMFYHGADIILQSHPHVLQPMEVGRATDITGRTKDTFVIYSLGNFISSQRHEPREATIMLKIDVSKEGNGYARLEGVRFVPCWVQFSDATGSPLIRVLPIFDALLDYQILNQFSLQPRHVDRMRRAHAEITQMYLGEAVPAEAMKREYVFYDREEATQA